jgi:hypothetical protein
LRLWGLLEAIESARDYRVRWRLLGPSGLRVCLRLSGLLEAVGSI